jgi:hypothetical protein
MVTIIDGVFYQNRSPRPRLIMGPCDGAAQAFARPQPIFLRRTSLIEKNLHFAASRSLGSRHTNHDQH